MALKDITIIDFQKRPACTERSRDNPKFKVGERVISDREGDQVLTIRKVRRDTAPPHDHWHYLFNESDTLADEGWLTLAPVEPKWVDVTQECVPRFDEGRLYLGIKSTGLPILT